VSLHYLGLIYNDSTTVTHMSIRSVPVLPDGTYDGSDPNAPPPRMPEDETHASKPKDKSSSSSSTFQRTSAGDTEHSTPPLRPTHPVPVPTAPVLLQVPVTSEDKRYSTGQPVRMLRPGTFMDSANVAWTSHALTPERMPLELLFVV
jgi:hypothetical protein